MVNRAFLELRYFRMRNGPQVDRTSAYLRDAWLPAAQRAGIAPVGIFASFIAPQNPTVLLVASYPSLAMIGELEFDADYMRMENSVLTPFSSLPQIEIPPASEQRIFEL